MAAPVGAGDVRAAVESLGLSGRAVCAHTSLSSFGRLEGGVDALIDAFLDEGCALVVPTFSPDSYLVDPPIRLQRGRNGWDFRMRRATPAEDASRFDPSSDAVGAAMGRVPAAVLTRPERVRGRHPLWSFTAIGPLASEIVDAQSPEASTGALRRPCELDGAVALIGVGLERCSVLHLAEELAGRRLFYRWALGPDGEVIECQIGGCSRGFAGLRLHLERHASHVLVGQSQWTVFTASAAVRAAEPAIREEPTVTHCGRADCRRCHDAVEGGPELLRAPPA